MTDKELLKIICDYTGIKVGEWFELNLAFGETEVCKIDEDGYFIKKSKNKKTNDNILDNFKTLKRSIKTLNELDVLDPTPFMKMLGVNYKDVFNLQYKDDKTLVTDEKGNVSSFYFDKFGNFRRVKKELPFLTESLIIRDLINESIIISKI